MFLIFIFFVNLLHIDLIRSCPLTDNYLSRCHCGILTNGESYIKCDENSLDHIPIFKRSFPYDELILSNNFITNLTRSAFDHIKTIKRIQLQNNRLSSIDPRFITFIRKLFRRISFNGRWSNQRFRIFNSISIEKVTRLKIRRIQFEWTRFRENVR